MSIVGILASGNSCYQTPVHERPTLDEIPAPKIATHNPRHNTELEQIKSNPVYLNIVWEDRDLIQTATDLASQYVRTHIYIEGETDCNDMAIDIWNMLAARGIVAIIVVGNRYKTNETFSECNHAWLAVFNSDGAALFLEPTNGKIYLAADFREYPELNQYRQGFFYTKPSDLKADLKERW
jgi:hypothetical protein